MPRGKVNIQTYDTIDLDACQGERHLLTNETVNNAIHDDWEDAMAYTLLQSDPADTIGGAPNYGMIPHSWSTTLRACADISSSYLGDRSGINEFIIEVSDTTNDRGWMISNSSGPTQESNRTNNSFDVIQYLVGVATTWSSAKCGMVTALTTATSGSTTFGMEMASASFTNVPVTILQTLKITWTFTFTDA